MSTNSTIAKKNADGTYTAIYCHWDGYPDHNGRILLEHYNDEGRINELLALGSLSILGDVIGEKVDFDTYSAHSQPDKPAQCVAYMRDRGEKDETARHFKTLASYNKYAQQEYNYLFDNGVWTVTDHRDEPKNLVEYLLEYDAEQAREEQNLALADGAK